MVWHVESANANTHARPTSNSTRVEFVEEYLMKLQAFTEVPRPLAANVIKLEEPLEPANPCVAVMRTEL